MERRDFLALVTAATVGSSLHPELERLGALLPGHAQPVTRPRIGAADVDAIEAITDGFRRSGFAQGGGLCRAAALAQLHQVRRLDEAVCSPEVHAHLLFATANLANTAAWTCFDGKDHDSARRLWTFAVDTARRVDEDHPWHTDLLAHSIVYMTYQALELDRPHEALRLAQLASATAANRKHPAHPITHSYVSAHQGWSRALLGEIEPCRRAMGQAQDQFTAVDPGAAPPWHYARHASDNELAGFLAGRNGFAWLMLSRSHPECAPDAIEQLRHAVDGYTAEARTRAGNLADLACAYVRAGDLDAAVTTGYDAVTAISGLSSTRGYARLRVLDTVTAPITRKPEIAELREHIHTALTTAA